MQPTGDQGMGQSQEFLDRVGSEMRVLRSSRHLQILVVPFIPETPRRREAAPSRGREEVREVGDQESDGEVGTVDEEVTVEVLEEVVVGVTRGGDDRVQLQEVEDGEDMKAGVPTAPLQEDNGWRDVLHLGAKHSFLCKFSLLHEVPHQHVCLRQRVCHSAAKMGGSNYRGRDNSSTSLAWLLPSVPAKEANKRW